MTAKRDWIEQAACAQPQHAANAEDWYADWLRKPYDAPTRANALRIRRALTVCASCPVVVECVANALRNESHGIWGLLAQERAAFGGVAFTKSQDKINREEAWERVLTRYSKHPRVDELAEMLGSFPGWQYAGEEAA